MSVAPGMEADSPSTGHRYPPWLIWGYLVAFFLALALLAYVFATDRHPLPVGANMIPAYASGVALPLAYLAGFLYYSRYRVIVAGAEIRIRGLWRTRRIALAPVRQLVITDGMKGGGLELLDGTGRSLAVVSKSVDDFSGLVLEVERATRGGEVDILRPGPVGGWMKRLNAEDSHFTKSDAPRFDSKRERRVSTWLVFVGTILIVWFYWYLHRD